MNPFVAYESLPEPPNRYKFKLPKKYEKDVDFQYPFAQLGFLSALRYVFPRFTVRPDGQYLRRYEWFRGACAVASAMLFPSYSYLSVQYPGLYYLAFFLDCSAYFDMFQRLLVAYYNEDGVLVYHPASTAAHYIKNAFLLDLLGCLPLETLEPLRLQSASEDFGYRGYLIIREHQYLMNNRLLQLYRFFETLKELSRFVREDIVLVVKFICIYLSLCNALTSALVLVTSHIYYTDYTSFGRYWEITDRKFSSRLGIKHDRKWMNEFHDSYRFNLTESPWNIHLAVYFWVIYETSTTGYHSVQPTYIEQLEVLFAGMFINKMITTYYAVRVISSRSNVNKALCKFQEQMRDINDYMHNEALDPTLQRKIQRYYEHNWDMVGGIDSTIVLKMCDQVSLRTDTILQIYGPTFYECPILSGCDTSLMRILSRSMRDIYFLHDTEVIKADEVISVMYIINNGSIDMQRTIDDKTRIAPLRRGSVFGNLDKETIRIPMRAVSTSNVHLLQIKSSVFHTIIADFPEVLIRMKQLRPHKECYITTAVKSVKALKRHRRKALYALELIENLENKVWTNNPAVLMFLISICLSSIYYDIYHVGFQNITTKSLIIMYILDFMFFLKIPILLSIPPNEEPPIKKKLKEFRRTYVRREFIWDLISVLPFETFCFAVSPVDWDAFAWLRLNRLFRISTIFRCLAHYRHRMSINLAAMTVTSIIIWFSIVMHAHTCIWYYISRKEEKAKPKSSWRYDNNGTSICEDDYICSLFFMITTFTLNGVGTILPRKHMELVYSIFVQIFSKMLFMIFVGEFANIIVYRNYRVFSYYRHCVELKAYLNNNDVSMNIVKLVNRYLSYLWRENRGIQIPRMLVTAPPAISRKILAAAYYRHLKEHAVFKICEPAFLDQLVLRLRDYSYVDDMFVVRENEVTDSMYFIHKGCVQEINKRTRHKRNYFAGDCFGSLQGLVRNQPFRFSYKTTSFAQIVILNMDRWEELLKFYPRSKIAIYGKTEGEDEDYHYPGSEEHLMKPDETHSAASLDSMESNYSYLDSTSNRIDKDMADFIKIRTRQEKKRKSEASVKSETLKEKVKRRASFFNTVPFKSKRTSRAPSKLSGDPSAIASNLSVASSEVMELPRISLPTLKAKFKSVSDYSMKEESGSVIKLAPSKDMELETGKGISFHSEAVEKEGSLPKVNRQMLVIKYKDEDGENLDSDDDDNPTNSRV